MPKLNELSISIGAINQGTFFSGQKVQGQVIVDLAEPMTMRGVRLHISGMSDVLWTETRGSRQYTVEVPYCSQEVYINEKIVVFGKEPGQGGDNPEHPAGRYTYPFQFQIPPTAPSSFEGKIGKVRYLSTAVIDRPWKFDHKSVTAFTVVNLLDLNREPQTLLGVDGENSKTLCCLCCKSGPIIARFRLNRHGYVPGEQVPCFAEIHNTSNRTMKNSFIKLVQVAEFHACGKTRRIERPVLQTLRKGEIPPGKTETWNGETIRLPALPPSRLKGCNIITIQYLIKLVVEPSGLESDLIVPLEVVIGSIPHWSIAQQYNPQAKAPTNVPEVNTGDDTAPPHIAYPAGMPQPQYSESVEGKANIRGEGDTEHTRGNAEFSPMYPYYNWGTPYNPDGLTVEGYRAEIYSSPQY